GTEELLFYRKGGAIAFFSATRAVFTTENRIFNQNIISELFSRNSDGNYQTIGKAYFLTKQVSISDNHRKYILFGDPLITLKIPDKIVKLDKVNKIDLNKVTKDTSLAINAYALLNLEGSIITPKDSSLVSDFNGIIEIVINDVGFTKIVTDIDGTKHNIYKDGGIIAKGFSKVTNGRFYCEFFITDEVSFLSGNISIRMFAFDTTNNIFAKGLESRLKISAIDTISTFVDNEPPVISIFIDDTTFKPGDIVSNPPTLIVKLYDNTAINTTGVGIGHLIEAWVDEGQESIDLTNEFESLVDNPKEGIIIKALPKLAPGSHTVKVRAWDIFNNYSTATTVFNILDTSAGFFLMNPIVKPNPATNNVTFRIQHNINEPYEVVLEIFNIFGQKVFEKSEDFNKLMNFEISYHCTDQFGNGLPTGIYIYSIKAKTSNKNASINGKFAIVN
ncbi:MAG: C25 family cysteine peptidase, partial [Candidatus Kapaibacteriota bacterium]